MEEELNENDLEERLYAMIHHVDGTQADEIAEQSHDASPRVEQAPRSTLRRYWRTGHNSPYQKVNTPKDAPIHKNTPNNKTTAIVNKNTPAPVNKSHAAAADADPKPKEEKNDAPDSPPVGLFILQNTVPQSYTKTVEILEIDDDEAPKALELESSDEDDVVEVALPPKPTITIESSDEDELMIGNDKNTKNKDKSSSKENKSPNKNNRDVSASPVPSVQSSMSDDFIRGDCIALNISSAQPDSQSFDFSLHGSDMVGVGVVTPSKKKRKKKSKDKSTPTITSTPITEERIQERNNTDSIFATPKSKAKNKKPKTKSYTVSEKIIPNPDIYDSDSNQSAIEVNKNHDVYAVTDKSFPSADVYESDSSVSESIKDLGKPAPQKKTSDSSNSNISIDLLDNTNATDKTLVVDLTNDYTVLNSTQIEENIVIGNISGYSDVHEYGDSVNNTTGDDLGEFCSTKVPQILFDDLDFDNLKGKDKVCRSRRYSLTTLRAEMDKFYNESWGGENFNHQEIQKNMSRDKSLWVIDPKDRMPNPPKRRVTCNYCNRVGHRDDTCRLKPPVCHMCGHAGHYEPRCPRKICVNCGSPNFMYSTMCRNCAPWRQLACAECGQAGHPVSHCPDTWRRYHNTIDENMPLERCGEKPHHQLQCSGCARRGHLAHSCRAFLPLCSLPVPAPRVARYRALYPPTHTHTRTHARDTHKRLSKSPTTHETHLNKRRNVSDGDLDRTGTAFGDERSRKNSGGDAGPRKNSDGENRPRKLSASAPVGTPRETENREAETPDLIPVGPNRDSRGRVIQDNEVSDTSEVKTSARIYMASEALRRLSTPEGREWLSRNMERFDVNVQCGDAGSFLTVVGTVGDQEAFHSELRVWSGRAEPKTPETEREEPEAQSHVMPKKKNHVLRKLNNAFTMLESDIGDPRAIYRELTYLQNRHDTIKSQKAISPLQLNKNRDRLNNMLKKLNMVLLGQAGLAGGAERLDALHVLHGKLINTRNQKVPNPLREEISRHYQTIFTPLARTDYADLLKKFYSTRPLALKNNSPGRNKKKKKKKIDQQQKPVLGACNKTSNNLSTEVGPMTILGRQDNLSGQHSRQLDQKLKEMTKRLSLFYERLLQDKPLNADRDAMRLNIAYEILETKKSLSEFEGQTKKLQNEKMRKAFKIQKQAKAFLNGGNPKKRNKS